MIRIWLLLMICLFASSASFSQKKAIVLQNLWNNELNSYSPKEFFERLTGVFKERLAVKELLVDSLSFKTIKANEGWDKKVQEQLKSKRSSADSAYLIAFSSDLRLPALNLGRFLFKNPPRSSKLTFTFHIYDGAGSEIMADTIINRGCLMKSIDEGKGSKFFYSDYKSFLDDMDCHLSVIKKILQEKQFAIVRKKMQEI